MFLYAVAFAVVYLLVIRPLRQRQAVRERGMAGGTRPTSDARG